MGLLSLQSQMPIQTGKRASRQKTVLFAKPHTILASAVTQGLQFLISPKSARAKHLSLSDRKTYPRL